MSFFDRLRAALNPQANTLTTSQELVEVLLQEDPSASGVVVTPKTAMMVAAVSAAIYTLSESAAQLPLLLYRRNGVRKERATDLPLWKLLHDRPNGWQNSYEWREMMTAQMATMGNCYSFINRVNGNRVHELLPVHPDRVKVEQNAETYKLEYTISTPSGTQLKVPQESMFHIRDHSVDGIVGVSRLKQGKDSIGLARAAEQWGGQLFGNGARPSGVLSTDQPLNEGQMKLIAESWKTAHGGSNALGTAVLDHGMKFSPMAMSNTDAQFLETRRFQIAEIARIYRIPPHMLGDLDRATFSNIEQQSLEFVKYSLMPWLRRWEGAINTQLIPQDGVFAEFLVEGLLRGDTKSRYEAYQIAITTGWMSPNEVRERENLNPREGGDDFIPAENIFGKREASDEPAKTTED